MPALALDLKGSPPILLQTKSAKSFNRVYALDYRNESKKANKIGCSTVILPRNRSHHYGEKKNRQTYLILQAFLLVIENLKHIPGLIILTPVNSIWHQ